MHRLLTSAEFTELADEHIKKVTIRLQEDIVGTQIAQKAFVDLAILCHTVKFCIIDENPVINLILT